MTAQPDVELAPGLRVSTDQVCRRFDGPAARWGKVEFLRTAGGWSVHDRGVAAGLYYDGCQVGQMPLRAGRSTVLSVGPGSQNFILVEVEEPPAAPVEDGLDELDQRPDGDLDELDQRELLDERDFGDLDKLDQRKPALVVEGLRFRTDEGRALLDGVTFELGERTLTAVIGPSGAGKSTLLRALSGQAAASSGSVRWMGADTHAAYDSLRYQIGFVPQEEILHRQLTVRQGLEYAAELRLPADTSTFTRERRVDHVIARMGLEAQQDQRIGSQLSGGQRKRVSIATELLTAPPLLFLDEPTSGLDPGLDRSVMHQLRGLADDGRVVVVATHSVLGLDQCDTIVALAKGGRVAYAGPPAGLLQHFEVDDYPDLFDLLETGDVPKFAAPLTTPRRRIPRVTQIPEPQPASSQLGTLIRRNLAVIRSDRLHLTLLILMPLLLAALARVVQGDAGLSLKLTRVDGGEILGGEAGQRLTILVMGAVLVGAAATVRELVGERAIFRREYAVGLSPGTYYFSKTLVFTAICFTQGVAMSWLALVGLPGPDKGGVHGWGWLEVAIPIGILAAALAAVGLWVSALVRTVEQTMPALVAVVMGQLVLSSAVVHLAGRPILDQLSWLAPARWAYAGGASSIDLQRAQQADPSAVVDPLFYFSTSQWNQNLVALAILALVAVCLGTRALARSIDSDAA